MAIITPYAQLSYKFESAMASTDNKDFEAIFAR